MGALISRTSDEQPVFDTFLRRVRCMCTCCQAKVVIKNSDTIDGKAEEESQQNIIRNGKAEEEESQQDISRPILWVKEEQRCI